MCLKTVDVYFSLNLNIQLFVWLIIVSYSCKKCTSILYCSVKTATMSMTSFYWPRSIKPSQQWLIIQGSTLTCLATNNCLTSFCFYLTCQLHIIFLKQSAVIFVCVLKKKGNWWLENFEQSLRYSFKEIFKWKIYFNTYCMYTENIVYFVSIKIPLGGVDPASNRLKSFFS